MLQKPHFSSSGFTLVEVVVGLTLFGCILVLLFSALHTTGKSWATIENATSRTHELQQVAQFIRQRLSQTVPLLWVAENKRQLAFSGSAHEIHFVGPLPAHRGGGGLYLYTLKLDGKTPAQLIMQYQRATPEHQSFDFSGQKNNGVTVVLMTDVDKLEFSYFGRAKLNENPTWYPAWKAHERLPDKVRLSLTPARAHDRWPELVIDLHAKFIEGQPQLYLTNRKDSALKP